MRKFSTLFYDEQDWEDPNNSHFSVVVKIIISTIVVFNNNLLQLMDDDHQSTSSSSSSSVTHFTTSLDGGSFKVVGCYRSQKGVILIDDDDKNNDIKTSKTGTTNVGATRHQEQHSSQATSKQPKKKTRRRINQRRRRRIKMAVSTRGQTRLGNNENALSQARPNSNDDEQDTRLPSNETVPTNINDDVDEVQEFLEEESTNNQNFSKSSTSFVKNVNNIPALYDVESISRDILENQNLFGDTETTKMLRELAPTSAAHQNKKKKVEDRFFFIIGKHPTFKELAEIIDNPKCPSKPIRRFYTIVKGDKEDHKKLILNATLILFSQFLIKKEFHGADLSDKKTFAEAQYQPNNVQVHFKVLFSVFSSEGIRYTLQKDFNERGDFLAYWRYVFDITKKYRPDYGTTPNSAQFDENWRQKRTKAIADGKLDLNNYKHHIMVLTEELMCCFNLRGSEEVSTFPIVFLQSNRHSPCLVHSLANSNVPTLNGVRSKKDNSRAKTMFV